MEKASFPSFVNSGKGISLPSYDVPKHNEENKSLNPVNESWSTRIFEKGIQQVSSNNKPKPYKITTFKEANVNVKLHSISAMPEYSKQSSEEIRWQHCDKGKNWVPFFQNMKQDNAFRFNSSYPNSSNSISDFNPFPSSNTSPRIISPLTAPFIGPPPISFVSPAPLSNSTTSPPSNNPFAITPRNTFPTIANPFSTISSNSTSVFKSLPSTSPSATPFCTMPSNTFATSLNSFSTVSSNSNSVFKTLPSTTPSPNPFFTTSSNAFLTSLNPFSTVSSNSNSVFKTLPSTTPSPNPFSTTPSNTFPTSLSPFSTISSNLNSVFKTLPSTTPSPNPFSTIPSNTNPTIINPFSTISSNSDSGFKTMPPSKPFTNPFPTTPSNTFPTSTNPFLTISSNSDSLFETLPLSKPLSNPFLTSPSNPFPTSTNPFSTISSNLTSVFNTIPSPIPSTSPFSITPSNTFPTIVTISNSNSVINTVPSHTPFNNPFLTTSWNTGLISPSPLSKPYLAPTIPTSISFVDKSPAIPSNGNFLHSPYKFTFKEDTAPKINIFLPNEKILLNSNTTHSTVDGAKVSNTTEILKPANQDQIQVPSLGIAVSTFSLNSYGKVMPDFGIKDSSMQKEVITVAVNEQESTDILGKFNPVALNENTTYPSGIRSMPIVDKGEQLQKMPLLIPRCMPQRSKLQLPTRSFLRKSKSPKVPFFSGDDEAISDREASASAGEIKQDMEEKQSTNVSSWPVENHGARDIGTKQLGENDIMKDPLHMKTIRSQDSVLEGEELSSRVQRMSVSEIPATTTKASSLDHFDIAESILPKLQHVEYYTQPSLAELATKEMEEPGYCSHIKDFLVGREDCGSVKFLGITDVRGLNLDDIIEFEKHEIFVYRDENKKHPVGQGLNKPAEITLSDIRCIDKKTGVFVLDGPDLQKYKAKLRKETEKQGAEFISYDAEKGEWKFQVEHFSK